MIVRTTILRPWTVLLWTVLPCMLLATPVRAAELSLVEVAAESGLEFTYRNGMTGQRYLPEIMGGGVALFDADGDGDLDVFFVQGGPLGPDQQNADAPPQHDRLFRNQLLHNGVTGPLRFQDVTIAAGFGAPSGSAAGSDYGMGVVAADFDSDGAVDLYVTNLGANRFWHNRGDGTFEDWTDASGTGDASWSIGGSALDYDHDGLLDLYVVNYVDFRFHRHRLCPSPSAQFDYCGPLNYPGLPDRLLRNLGPDEHGVLRFEDVTAQAGVLAAQSRSLGSLAADFDDDGWVDLYVANDQMANHLWRNQGDGTFTDEALLAGVAVNAAGAPEASMGVDAADFDHDGDLDLFLTHLRDETNTLYVNEGAGLFTDRTERHGLGGPSFALTGFGTSWVDLDLDGWLDLVAVNGAIKSLESQTRAGDPLPLRQRNQIYLATPPGEGGIVVYNEVENVPFFGGAQVSRGLAVGDLDNDGDADLVVVDIESPALLLRNDAVGESWWGVELQGSASPHQALGSTLRRVGPESGTLRRGPQTDGSYASSRDPRLLLRSAGAPFDEIEVSWTSGRVERFPLTPHRYQTLVEGAGSVSTKP